MLQATGPNGRGHSYFAGMTRSRLRAFAGAGTILAIAAAWLTWREPDYRRVPVRSLGELERELESLRVRSRIPGMSAAIAEGGRVIWARGFGVANRERGTAAGPDTIYFLASLTKPYASTILFQLVQEGRLSLDDSVSRFDIAMPRSVPVTVRHLMSHTSGEPPGASYRYDGNAYGRLTQVIERTTGQPYAKELADRIIRPLALTRTAPNPGEPRAFWSIVASVEVTGADFEQSSAAFTASGADRQAIEAGVAQGYARAWGRSLWPTGLAGPMPHGFTLSATAGLVASPPDVARFSIPADRATFVILANSDGLSRWRGLGDSADVTASPAAALFINWTTTLSGRTDTPGARAPR
jgi:CubicO group peptidase (beta-lactamase class C family)